MTTTTAAPRAPLLLEGVLPAADAATAVTVVVEATAEATYAAVKSVDFARMPQDDPFLFWALQVRALPDRIARAVRHEPPEPQLAEAGARLGDMTEGPDAWIRLGEEPGSEFAFGAIGRFLGAEVSWRPTTAAEFASFDEPGWVRVAAGLSVRPYGERSCLLTYDCRAAATDEPTRRAFARYWRWLSPGIRFVLRRAALAIKREAESTGWG